MANAIDHKRRMGPVKATDTPASTPQVELTTEDSTPIILEDGATYITTEAA